jgi:hypothetical protein
MRYHYIAEPHPHLVVDEIVPPSDYATLRFPDALIEPGASWGITSSDPQYAKVLEDPAWRSIHDTLRGEAFVTSVMRAFAGDMRREGCLVDPDRAHLVPFTESRAEKELASLASGADPNEIFTRLDFQSKGEGGYRQFVHLDWPRRLVGGILFFSDAREEGLEGGELALYRDRSFRDDRWCHEPELAARFPPVKNSGVIFLNSNGAFHGPRAITRLRGRRRWLYYTISSKVDVWPHESRMPAAAAMT